jgi:hypothetical protein
VTVTGNSRSPADPIERVIEAALAPAISSRITLASPSSATWRRLREQIAKTEHGRAVALYEYFIAGSYEKGSEVADSSG